jgi:hypothetical protein
MRVYGFFRGRDPFIRVTLNQSHWDNPKAVEFLLDTGSSQTVLNEGDARDLGIELARLPKSKDVFGVGGRVTTLTLADVLFSISADDGGVVIYRFDLPVLKHRTRDSTVRRRLLHLPSLLGRDVLQDFTLVINWPESIVFLTDETIYTQ